MVDRQGSRQLSTSVAPPRRLVIATRESRLALWQAHHVQRRLQALYPACSVELLGMTTTGDQVLDRQLSEIGGKGLFTKELEIALRDGRADLAVHSLKDVPMELDADFALGAVLEREDPRDAFVSNRHASIDAMPDGGRVGTSSLRRAALLADAYPALRFLPLRGNLDTRLRKLDAGEYDALILAAAGLKRLGLADRIRQVLPPQLSVPAPGQGALGIEILATRHDVAAWIAPLAHERTWIEVSAEREVSRALGGSCRIPLAAYCTHDPQGGLRLDAMLSVEGEQGLRRVALAAPEGGFDAALRLGEQAADRLGASGGRA